MRASNLFWLKALMEQNGARGEMPVKRSKFADAQRRRSDVAPSQRGCSIWVTTHLGSYITLCVLCRVSQISTRFQNAKTSENSCSVCAQTEIASARDGQEESNKVLLGFCSNICDVWITQNNSERLPSRIRVCLQELYGWRLVRAVPALRRGLCLQRWQRAWDWGMNTCCWKACQSLKHDYNSFRKLWLFSHFMHPESFFD